MITLNDYLYSGDTVLKILQKYTRDLRKEAKLTHNEIDMMHVNFLIQITELLEHNDFLTAQSQKIREFYKYMAHEYPFLAFTFKGRIKSLIRAEEKFNGYIVEYIYDYYTKHGTYPSVPELKNKLSCFRDFIAYRIVLCMPKCHLKPGSVGILVKNSGNPDSTCDRSGQIYTCGIFYYFVPDMDSFEKSVSFYFLSYGSAGDIYKYP